MQDVSKILTRKYYGKKDPFRSREFRQPRWMELLAVLLFTVSGLGEGKSINAVLGGLPKAVTLAFVGLAGLEFFIRGDFDRLKKLAGPSGLYILYLAVLAAWSMFIWVRNFTAFASITRGVEKILYQSIATVVAICCVYLYGRFSIDLDRFGYRPQVRAKLRAEYGLNDKLVVGCVARLMAQKNHTRLLDIFAALKKVRPDSCLLLVGEGELRAELEAKAARLGIAQDVKFLGVQSDTSVWYQAMDVFVMPSLFEGLPVVGMEAQASGLPCVFSTGVTEEVLLRPDSCRISLEQPDEAWAAVLKDVDRNLPDRAQAAAQVRAAGYDIRQETLRLQQLYTGLIAERGAAHA